MKIKPFLALFLLFSILLPALAQTTPATPPQSQKPNEDDVVRITTNLVQVDAVVTKDGKPVSNLTADDFEIYEDGKKQTITSFAYISNVPGTTAQPITTAREKGREVVPYAPIRRDQPHRTIAFVVDDLGLSAESMGQVRHQLRKFITEQLQPNDLVAIIRTGGEVGALQQFTNDRRILSRALDQLRWNPCSRLGLFLFRPDQIQNSDGGDSACSYSSMRGTARALRFILDAMGELPGRKSMVLLSDSLPVESQDLGIREDSSNDDTEQAFNSISYTAALKKIAEKAIRASVVIYSVDTQGLAITGLTAADSTGFDPLRGGRARDINSQINAMLSARTRLMWSRREGGDMIARQTGGFQIRNSNSFEFNRILEDQSGYYLLGYRPNDETFNRRFHHIKAKVKRSGMTLRTRFGFVGVSEEEAKKDQPSVKDLTNLALISPFGAQDVNVDITSYFANDKTIGSVVRSFVYLDAKDLAFSDVNGRRQATIELHGVIFGDNGKVVEQVTRDGTLSLSQHDYEQAMRYGMKLTFDIPVKRAGAYQVRIAARDKNSSRIGSAGQFVAVPDLSKKKPAVSGIVLATAINPANQALANPGARHFTPNSDLHFAYVLYNATNESGGLRNLVMQARLFREGKNIYSGPEVPITAANQTDLNRVLTSGVVRLPPDLEPGSYYLQVLITEVGAKKAVPVVQWAEFEIEKR